MQALVAEDVGQSAIWQGLYKMVFSVSWDLETTSWRTPQTDRSKTFPWAPGSTNRGWVPQNTCNTCKLAKCNSCAKCLAKIFGHVLKAVLQRSLARVDSWVASVEVLSERLLLQLPPPGARVSFAGFYSWEVSCCNYHPRLPRKGFPVRTSRCTSVFKAGFDSWVAPLHWIMCTLFRTRTGCLVR